MLIFITTVEMAKSADEQKFILNFIERYESLPALWNTKLEAYSNREEKRKQYLLLLDLYEEQYTGATIDDVKKKINVLRTNYQREKQKIAKNNRSAAGAADVDEPSLFYFHQLKFLDEVEKPSTSRSTMNLNNEAVVNKARKRKEDVSNNLLEIAAKRFAPKERSATRMAAESWAAKLEEMEPVQRMLCEKFIGEIIFEGQMGTLNRNSVKISPGNKIQERKTDILCKL